MAEAMSSDNFNLKSGDGGKKFVRPPTYYDAWQEGEGIPIYKVFHVENMVDVKLGRWERYGCDGAFVNLADPYITAAFILELAPGQQTNPIKHMFETWCYIIDGIGQTTVEQPGHGQPGQITWGKRALFGPPLNTTYFHRNLDKGKPARILMVTNAPLTLNLFHNSEFVFNNPFVFQDRFDGRQGFFNAGSEHLGGRVARTNFIPDTLAYQLLQWKDRGFGAKSFHFSMSDHTSAAHLSEFEVGTYKMAHRHGPGAHVIILKGQGFSLCWKEGEQPRRVDWREGSMFAPPEWWFHQHFNTGPEPARYLALRRGGSPEHPMKLGMSGGKDAPDQIEHEEEPAWIYDTYAEELEKNGVKILQPRPNYTKERNTLQRPTT